MIAIIYARRQNQLQLLIHIIYLFYFNQSKQFFIFFILVNAK